MPLGVGSLQPFSALGESITVIHWEDWLMTLSSAEFKALRESMGLTTKWLSRRWGVAEYSVQRWESKRSVSERYARDMLELKAQFDRTVWTAAAAGRNVLRVPRQDAGRPADAFPASYERAVAERVRELTGAQIVYEDEEAPQRSVDDDA